MAAEKSALERSIDKLDLFCRRNNLTIMMAFSVLAYFFSGPGVFLDAITFADFRPIGWNFQFKFIAAMVFLIMFSAGVKISKKDLLSLMKARRAFCAASLHVYVFSPLFAMLLAFTLTTLWKSDFMSQISLGLALVAASPCAGAAMYWLIDTKGNIPFGAALVTVSGSLSPITMPFLLNLIAGVSAKNVISFWSTAQFLLMTIWLPLLLAGVFNALAPAVSLKVRSFVSFLGTMSVILVNYVIVAKTSSYLRSGLSFGSLLIAFAIVMFYVACNFAFGYLIGGIFKTNDGERVSLSFMGAMRNNSVATAVGTASFADTFPYAIIPPTLAVFHHAIAKVVAVWLIRRQRPVEAPVSITKVTKPAA